MLVPTYTCNGKNKQYYNWIKIWLIIWFLGLEICPNASKASACVRYLSLASDSRTTVASRSFLIFCCTSSSCALVHLFGRKGTDDGWAPFCIHVRRRRRRPFWRGANRLTTPPWAAASQRWSATSRSQWGSTCSADLSTWGQRKTNGALKEDFMLV